MILKVRELYGAWRLWRHLKKMFKEEKKMVSKPMLRSKTAWGNVLLAALVFFPPINEYVSQNPEVLALGWAAVNMLLRLITKGKVTVT